MRWFSIRFRSYGPFFIRQLPMRVNLREVAAGGAPTRNPVRRGVAFRVF
jgi:hypothetical protein